MTCGLLRRPAQRSRRPVEPHGDRLPHRRTVRERGNEVQGQPHRGQVIETLPHGLVRQIQDEIRQEGRHQIRAASETAGRGK